MPEAGVAVEIEPSCGRHRVSSSPCVDEPGEGLEVTDRNPARAVEPASRAFHEISQRALGVRLEWQKIVSRGDGGDLVSQSTTPRERPLAALAHRYSIVPLSRSETKQRPPH